MIFFFNLIRKIFAVILVMGMFKFLYDMLFPDENDKLVSKHDNEK